LPVDGGYTSWGAPTDAFTGDWNGLMYYK
jgi:hypothetical protein